MRITTVGLSYVLWSIGFSSAAAHPDSATKVQVDELKQRIENLERKLESQHPADAATEAAAREKLRAGSEAISSGDVLVARKLFADVIANFANTEAAERAHKLHEELAVIGQAAPADFVIEKWIQHSVDENADVNLHIDLSEDAPKLTMLLFWEAWCPHSRKNLPLLQEYDYAYRNMMTIVAVTKITRSATEEQVWDVINNSDVHFGVAKETGELSKHFNVRGIPAVAVVKQGKTIWRGHPGRLSDTLITSWFEGLPARSPGRIWNH